MKQLAVARAAGILLFLFLSTVISSHAQTFNVLAHMDIGPGQSPLLQGRDGNFYGMDSYGGTHGMGDVFKITPSGTVTILYNFCSQTLCTDGATPEGGLVQGADGNYYGTTTCGGPSGLCYGTVFKITASGELTTLYTFCSQTSCTDGTGPTGLVLATDGNFYGTTGRGGLQQDGTVFKITPLGVLTTLYSFCSQSGCADGQEPATGLVQGVDGAFYGVTSRGGPNTSGTVFKITSAGTLTVLYGFCSQTNCADGSQPIGKLIQSVEGNFYGTTSSGGSSTFGNGTAFKITPGGILKTLYVFCSAGGNSCPDGANPNAGLVQATDGNFYGTTSGGGYSLGQANCQFRNVFWCGTIFMVTPAGRLTTLYDFCSETNCADSGTPISPLIQATSGTFYGSAPSIFAGPIGTLFSLSTGLGPFVEPRPSYGNVGATIEILGNALHGTTAVSFDGSASKFKIISATEITAVVPAGATTGYVTVTTPAATLKSNVVFRVTK